MDWKDVGKIVGKAAPLIGSILGGPAGGAAGSLVASVLGTDGSPEATAKALQDPAALQKLKELELEKRNELARLHLEAETARLSEIHQSYRKELASSDPYIARWRPTFGYAMSLGWLLTVLGMLGTFIWSLSDPAITGVVLNGVAKVMDSISIMWSVGLGVLGVSIHQRSQDKKVAAGQDATGVLGRLINRVAGSRGD